MNVSSLPSTVGEVPRQQLQLLFTLFITMLIEAVSRVGGIRLAHQFEQQLNHYARQQGLDVPTDLGDFKQGSPNINDDSLMTAYRSSSQYAQSLAGQILGARLLNSTLSELQNSLTPQLRQINDHYELVPLPQSPARREEL
jgi:hypothetical protein